MSHQPSDELSSGTRHVQSKKRVDYLFALLLLIVLFAILIAILALSVLIFFRFVDTPPDVSFLNRIQSAESQLIVGILLLLLIALVISLLARWRVKRIPQYQFSKGCPVCRKHDMIRVHRRRYHRWFASALRLPIRMYACRNCQWQGVMLFYPAPDPAVDGEPKSPDGQELSRQSAHLRESDDNSMLQSVEDMVAREDPDKTRDELLPEIIRKRPDSSSEIQTEPESSILAEVEPTVVGYSLEENPAITTLEKLPSSSVGLNSSLLEEVGTSIGEADLVPPQHKDEACGERILSRAIVVAPYGVSLRAAPDASAEIICLLRKDTIIGLFEIDDDDSAVNWRRICCDGQVGWVSAAFLRHLHD